MPVQSDFDFYYLYNFNFNFNAILRSDLSHDVRTLR